MKTSLSHLKLKLGQNFINARLFSLSCLRHAQSITLNYLQYLIYLYSFAFYSEWNTVISFIKGKKADSANILCSVNCKTRNLRKKVFLTLTEDF